MPVVPALWGWRQRGLEVQVHPLLHSKSEGSLGYVRLHLHKRKIQTLRGATLAHPRFTETEAQSVRCSVPQVPPFLLALFCHSVHHPLPTTPSLGPNQAHLKSKWSPRPKLDVMPPDTQVLDRNLCHLCFIRISGHLHVVCVWGQIWSFLVIWGGTVISILRRCHNSPGP